MAEPATATPFSPHYKSVSNQSLTSSSNQNPEAELKDEEIELFYPRNSLDTYIPPENEKLPVLPKGPVFSLHVGYVATGQKHSDRTPAHIALVNEWSNIVRNIYIRPKQRIVSYLTPLTRIDEDILNKYGLKEQRAFGLIKEALCPDVILIGHCPWPNVEALGLKKGKHYRKILDLNVLWQVWNPTFKMYTRFSIEHLVKTVLNVPYDPNAVSQAINCVRLWNYYSWCRTPTHQWRLRMLRRHIIEAPRVESYSGRVKCLDGVCLGAKRACVCHFRSKS